MSSYYIGKLKSGNWRLLEQCYKEGKSVQQTVPKMAYPALGFRLDMTLAEARERVSRLNKESTIERLKAASTARRVKQLEVNNSVYLPQLLAEEFTHRIAEKTMGTESHKAKLLSHWQYIQTMVNALKLLPKDFFDESHRIYFYLKDHGNSVDYSKKLLRILNQWGSFVSKNQGSHYEPVANPRGQIKQQISKANQLKDAKVRRESEILKPSVLSETKTSLLETSYNWLYLSVWLGLRPFEVDELSENERSWKLTTEGGTKVVWVYQSKLVNIDEEKRWKPIPLIFEEQIKVLAILKLQNFKRPSEKEMKKTFPDSGITLYGGRKGFIDLMLDRGQKIDDISQWMGHQNIQTTWGKYRNRRRVSWTKTG